MLQSGPLYRLGEIRVEGLSRYDAEAVTRLTTFGPGTPYNEQLLLDFQERLQKLGLFEGATVELDAKPDTSNAAPVLVRVRELPLQQATVGLGFSANTWRARIARALPPALVRHAPGSRRTSSSTART